MNVILRSNGSACSLRLDCGTIFCTFTPAAGLSGLECAGLWRGSFPPINPPQSQSSVMQKCFYYAAMHHTPHSTLWWSSISISIQTTFGEGPQVSQFHVECVETICLPKILDRSFLLLGTYLNILYSSKYRCQRWGTLQHTHEGRNKQMAMKGKKNAAESWTVLTSHLNCSLHVGVQDRLYLAVSIHNMFWLDTL